MKSHQEQLFQGLIAAEYEKLKLICPAAADISRRVGEFVGTWRMPETSGIPELLEIGCGTGVTTQCLLHSRPDLRVTAIDNSPAMLRQAQQNLAVASQQGRLFLLEIDALSHLQALPAKTVDIVASGYALHNFMEGYRDQVLEEIFRVLKPGGLFVNGDRYALDDTLEQLRLTQAEVRDYFRVFSNIGRLDLLEEWMVHLFSDESPDHVMRLEPALERMTNIGFLPVTVHVREGVNALVSGAKPWP